MTEPDVPDDLERADVPLTTDPEQQRDDETTEDGNAGEGGAG